MTEALAAKAPTDFNLETDVAEAHQYLGDVLLQHGDRAEALMHYKTALRIAEHLTTTSPTDAGDYLDAPKRKATLVRKIAACCGQ
jgi:hypothetical protein